MGFFQKLFSTKKPTLKKEDIPNIKKVTEFISWFIKNEPIANAITNRSSNIIFNEGYRPKAGTNNNPESVKQNISSLAEWFTIKLFIDLNMLKDVSKDDFKKYIDMLDEASIETLTSAGKTALKYNLNLNKNFDWSVEIQKIPKGIERESFKIDFLDDNVLGAEIRILAWLYYEYFGEWYQLREKRR